MSSNMKNNRVFGVIPSPKGKIYVVVDHLERSKPHIRIEKIE
jgi:hypothetical protein